MQLTLIGYITLSEAHLTVLKHEVSQDTSKIFLRNGNEKRPVYGGTKIFQEDSFIAIISSAISNSMAIVGRTGNQ
ncbi:MAG: hypothetical protein JST89_17735 [Cyanobacteria bacterium SZAS-4]|nr:hypothetical protein [Cyanobacteria bacterium SZAS-4]